MTEIQGAQAQQEVERLPTTKRYCVWKCPTHTTNQRPQGKAVKAGCNHIQYRVTDPTKRTQATCKKCGKKPQMDEGNYIRMFAYDKRGKLDAIAYIEALRSEQGWER